MRVAALGTLAIGGLIVLVLAVEVLAVLGRYVRRRRRQGRREIQWNVEVETGREVELELECIKVGHGAVELK